MTRPYLHLVEKNYLKRQQIQWIKDHPGSGRVPPVIDWDEDVNPEHDKSWRVHGVDGRDCLC